MSVARSQSATVRPGPRVSSFLYLRPQSPPGLSAPPLSRCPAAPPHLRSRLSPPAGPPLTSARAHIQDSKRRRANFGSEVEPAHAHSGRAVIPAIQTPRSWPFPLPYRTRPSPSAPISPRRSRPRVPEPPPPRHCWHEALRHRGAAVQLHPEPPRPPL